MLSNRSFHMVIVIGLLVVTACAPQGAPVQNDAITLRLAVADAEGRPSDPYVREFIEQVKTLSNGNITIEPIWAAAGTTPVFEQGVIKALLEGQYDLGLAGSRAFDTQGVTSFQALQAPFLITNDALAEAVAASDIAARMLDNLSSSGAVGLTLWPEDLRHPFSVVPDKQILSPEDFAGLNVRATPSNLTYKLLEEFGAAPMMGDSDYEAAESGLRQGFSLTGTPTATGNVIFFPKFQVLFANGAAFEKLSEAQQNILREAAIATQKNAIAQHPREVEAATTWCADGGTIVLASEEQVSAFEAAAQPIFDSIAKEPLNAEFVAAIRELKANTKPSLGAEACNGAVIPSGPETTSENQVWSEGLPPNGVWQVDVTSDDFLRMGVNRAKAAQWVGMYTWTFKDGKAQIDFQGPVRAWTCYADYAVVGDVVRFTYDTSGTSGICSYLPVEVDDIQWRLDEDGLHLHLVAIKYAPFLENKAYLEAKPWQKIADQ